MGSRADGNGDAAPLGAADPRFTGEAPPSPPAHERRLVPSTGPGPDPRDPWAQWLRILIPATFALVLAGVVGVFVAGLDPGDGRQAIGPETAVRAAVAQRPQRVCYEDSQPCAWLALVDGRLLAFNTSGPLNEEFGRLGVAWCPSSRYYGSNVTGSRFDPRGNVVRGPAPRGLDRFALVTDGDGTLIIDYFSLTTGLQAGRADELLPPAGPDCTEIPFDREADLELESPRAGEAAALPPRMPPPV